ncbi:MAG: hypothetical protein AAGD32_01315 [Planctomycetota bacterium]
MRAVGNLWAIPVLCLGLGLMACAVLVPAAAETRDLALRRDVLQQDLDHLDMQAARNAQLLNRIGQDPVLAQRLERRQLNRVEEGAEQVAIGLEPSPFASTPFALVAVETPSEIPVATTRGGRLMEACLDGRGRLVVFGFAGLCIATGLVCGSVRE